MEQNRKHREDDDGISVVHSKEEDSPREEINKDDSDLPAGEAEPKLLSAERDEGAGLDHEQPLRKSILAAEGADISPRTIVNGEEIGAVDESDEQTLAKYERPAGRAS